VNVAAHNCDGNAAAAPISSSISTSLNTYGGRRVTPAAIMCGGGISVAGSNAAR
jgi:hypothetical protein